MIYLQSFFTKPKGIPNSAARWQPKGFNHPTIKFLVPIRKNGSPIKNLPPNKYMVEYCKHVLKPNIKIIKQWTKTLLEGQKQGLDLTICCWCSSRRQKLLCHTILIGYILEYLEPELQISYLDGRENPVWTKEEFYREMGF